MARSAIAKAEAAAEAVEAFRRARLRADDDAAADGPLGPASADALLPEEPRLNAQPVDAAGHSPKAVPHSAGAVGQMLPFRLPHTDWLHHRLTVTGPVELIAAFQEAACGAGTIPWQLDMTSLGGDWFHRLVDPAHRSLSLQGARILAAQLREAVERRHALAVARVGHSRACPFDLHTLVPVPPAILALGPDDPAALAWLWEHWGSTEALRHVAVDTDEARTGREPYGPGWALQFWSADWTPWRALARIRTEWPALRFDVQPGYGCWTASRTRRLNRAARIQQAGQLRRVGSLPPVLRPCCRSTASRARSTGCWSWCEHDGSTSQSSRSRPWWTPLPAR
jgi:hypothetical protein